MAETPTPQATTELDRIVRAIVDEADPLEVILFGSEARGDAGPDSDIDLLVVMPDGIRRVAAARSLHRALYEAIPERRRAVDIVVTTPARLEYDRGASWSVVNLAAREGVTVYRRDATAHG